MIWDFGWTWESNPGPKGCQTRHPPLSQTPVIVNVVDNEDNIKKTIIMLGTRKSARDV